VSLGTTNVKENVPVEVVTGVVGIVVTFLPLKVTVSFEFQEKCVPVMVTVDNGSPEIGFAAMCALEPIVNFAEVPKAPEEE